MKKVYLTVGVALVSVGAFAQAINAPSVSKQGRAVYREAHTAVVSESQGVRKGGAACIFSEDFSGGSIPSGWTLGTPAAGADNWAVGNATGASSQYYAIPDVPAGNTFAYINDDDCNCDLSDATLTTPAIDLSGPDLLGVTFDTFFTGEYGSTAVIDVSVDGGTTFVQAGEVAGVSGAWHQVSVPLGDYAGEADVRIRFHFSDNGEWGSGFTVDNVCVAMLPDNDLVMLRSWAADVKASSSDPLTPNLEYRLIPSSQTAPMNFSAKVANQGGMDQTGVILSVTADNGTPMTSNPVTIAAGSFDTIVLHSSYVPGTGAHSVEFSVYSSDPNDATPENNGGAVDFAVSEEACSSGNAWQMALDNSDLYGGRRMSLDTTWAPYSAYGAKYQIPNTGSMAYGIGVVLDDRTQVGALITVLLERDSVSNGDTYLINAGSSDVYEVQASDLSGAGGSNVVFIPFDPVASDPLVVPVPLDPTEDYEAYVTSNDLDSVWVGVSTNMAGAGSSSAYDETANGGAGGFILFSNDELNAPMIRLFLADGSCLVGISELAGSSANAVLGPNMPNPFNGHTTINYSLVQGATVSLDIYDMTGHLVMTKTQGKQGAGSHMIDLDGTPLAQGVYTYMLTAGQDRLARRMVVTK